MASVLRAALLVLVVTFCSAACGGGAGEGTDSQIAFQIPGLPTEPTQLPLQSNAPAIGADVPAPPRDLVRRQLTENQARAISRSCQDASEIVPGSECAQSLAATESAPPCGEKDLCLRIAQAGETTTGRTGASGYLMTPYTFAGIRDQRPGSPLCPDGPDGLCWVLPVDPAAVPEILATGSPR
jgi:hypothetical protein